MSSPSRSDRLRRTIPRRGFLADVGMGFTGLALGEMLLRDGIARANDAHASAPPSGQPHFQPKAKSVIWIFLVGGMSHMESFDPKPALNEFAGQEIGETPHKDVLTASFVQENLRVVVPDDANGHIRHKLFPLQVGYSRDAGKAGWKSATGFRTSARVPTTWRSCVRCGPPTTTTARNCSFIPAATCSKDSSPRSARGCTTAWVRSTTICRGSSCWARPSPIAAAASAPTGPTTWGPSTAACSWASIPRIRCRSPRRAPTSIARNSRPSSNCSTS